MAEEIELKIFDALMIIKKNPHLLKIFKSLITEDPEKQEKKIVLTKELLNALKSDKGGFKHGSFSAIGITIRNNTGWFNRAIGTQVDEQSYNHALLTRNNK